MMRVRPFKNAKLSATSTWPNWLPCPASAGAIHEKTNRRLQSLDSCCCSIALPSFCLNGRGRGLSLEATSARERWAGEMDDRRTVRWCHNLEIEVVIIGCQRHGGVEAAHAMRESMPKRATSRTERMYMHKKLQYCIEEVKRVLRCKKEEEQTEKETNMRWNADCTRSLSTARDAGRMTHDASLGGQTQRLLLRFEASDKTYRTRRGGGGRVVGVAVGKETRFCCEADCRGRVRGCMWCSRIIEHVSARRAAAEATRRRVQGGKTWNDLRGRERRKMGCSG
jgi:hypothetical protein